MNYRAELKYSISYADAALVRIRLQGLMKKDPHATEQGIYTIRSLYFDDYYNTAYNEKYMGALDRQKFRIRIYNYSDDVIHLERKIKWNDYIYKQTSSLNVGEVNAIIAGNYDCLLSSSCPLNQLFYYECISRVMRPRVVIDYEREPYILDVGNVRINFDFNVRAGVGGVADFFDEQMATINVLEKDQIIMEVKFTEFLPEVIRQVLPPESFDFVAVSKYVLGCDKTLFKRVSSF